MPFFYSYITDKKGMSAASRIASGVAIVASLALIMGVLISNQCTQCSTTT
jgi:hypothetical protein